MSDDNLAMPAEDEEYVYANNYRYFIKALDNIRSQLNRFPLKLRRSRDYFFATDSVDHSLMTATQEIPKKYMKGR